MSFSKTFILPVTFLALAAVIFIQWSIQHVWEADVRTCAVYNSYYEQLQDKNAAYFKPASVTIRERWNGIIPPSPTIFKRKTGNTETVTDQFGTHKREKFESFKLDTSEFFRHALEEPSEVITNCFSTGNDRPSFFDGTIDDLISDHRKALPDRSDKVVTLYSVSPVGFSDDGELAILFVEQTCGGLCGWGGFVLFEFEDKKWSLAGFHTEWTS